MNILIDATCITRNKAGVGVYAENLIRELTSLSGDQRFFILAQDDDPTMDHSGCPNVTMIWVAARFFRILPLRFLLEQVVLPFLLLKHRIDVVHSLHYSMPLLSFGTKRVVTIHDMTFFDMPEVHEPFKVFYFRLFIRAAARFADGLIFVSHSAERDCEARFGRFRGRSWVIHHGKSEAFGPDLDRDQVEKVRSKYGLETDFALYIGTLEPRKNVARLIGAFAIVAAKRPQINLVIAGMKGWMYEEIFGAVERLGLECRVIFTGFVPEAEKPFLLSAATMFVYPSLYEGFGLPVLEALACGIPTVTSKTSSLPEVAGTAALLIDPTSEAEIATAVQRLYSDPDLRTRLRADSLRHAAEFTWRKTALATFSVYRGVLGFPAGIVQPNSSQGADAVQTPATAYQKSDKKAPL